MDGKIKLVCFDLNKTLIHENTWFELNIAMGMTKEEDDYLLNEYNKGKLSYIDWQKKLEEIYLARGNATKDNILRCLYHYTYKHGAKEIVHYLKNNGYKLSLLSGSVDILVERVAKELAIDLHHANNRFVFNNGYLAKLECLDDEIQAKTNQFKSDCIREGVLPTQAACVGDGDNDLGLFRLSKHGITFRDSKIEKEAWKVIDTLEDIRQIL